MADAVFVVALFAGAVFALALFAAGAVFVVAIGGVILILPSPRQLAHNPRGFGTQDTETPLPLKDAMRVIVHPDFPAAAAADADADADADILFPFRVFPVAAQLLPVAARLLPCAAIGLFFGPFAERPLGPRREAAGAGTWGPAPVAA